VGGGLVLPPFLKEYNMEECALHREKIEQLEGKMDSMLEAFAGLKKILVGNGEIGVAEKARRSFEFVQKYDQSKNGLFDWAFRLGIVIALGWIGLK
jgi:hypothetical protein